MVLLLLLSLALILLSGDGVPDAAGRLACAVRAGSVARLDARSTCHLAALVFAACFC